MSDKQSLNAARMLPGQRAVVLTRTASVNVGVRMCDWCRCETPPPTDHEVAEFVKHNETCTAMWPFDSHHYGNWEPVGWTKHLLTLECGYSDIILCPACSRAIRDAVTAARQARQAS